MLFKRNPFERQRGGTAVKRCSFCQKAEREVAKLIAGPSAFICDECVRVCTGILGEDTRIAAVAAPSTDEHEPVAEAGRMAYCTFCGRPIEWDEAVLVPEQGAYCPACAAEDSKPGA